MRSKWHKNLNCVVSMKEFAHIGIQIFHTNALWVLDWLDFREKMYVAHLIPAVNLLSVLPQQEHRGKSVSWEIVHTLPIHVISFYFLIFFI